MDKNKLGEIVLSKKAYPECLGQLFANNNNNNNT